MKILKFKTNINSEEDVKTLRPYLDQESTISRWNIDTDNPENVLSASGEELEIDTVKKLVEKAGYEAEAIHVLGAGGGDI